MKPVMHADMSIEQIMRRWPQTIAVVLRYRMLCVGCPISPFHTVTQICREHGVDETAFLRDLASAIGNLED